MMFQSINNGLTVDLAADGTVTATVMRDGYFTSRLVKKQNRRVSNWLRRGRAWENRLVDDEDLAYIVRAANAALVAVKLERAKRKGREK